MIRHGKGAAEAASPGRLHSAKRQNGDILQQFRKLGSLAPHGPRVMHEDACAHHTR